MAHTLASSLFVFASVASVFGGVCRGNTSPVLNVDFDNHQIGSTYTSSNLRSDFHTESTNSHFRGTKIVKGYSGAGLQITYPSGCVGTDCTLFVATSFPASNEAYVSFRVKFVGNFDFRKGGKLPGLCGGDCNSGFSRSSGYDGFSSRIMWREKGKLVNYLYHPGQDTSYGDDYAWSASAKKDGWITLSQRVVLNDGKSSDGVLQGWKDGSSALSKNGVLWRKTDGIKLDTFLFATFFGGSGSSWAPKSDQYAVFDDILVCA